MFSLVVLVPVAISWSIGGGILTTLWLALFTSLPIVIAYWTYASTFSPRINDKAKYPGRPVEFYLSFTNEADRKKYKGSNKIPMETFTTMYFDGRVDFNGDALDALEYRHDWATFRFTIGIFRFVLFNLFPEVLLHSRSQGMMLQFSTYILSTVGSTVTIIG